jgi:uncharacterized protein YegJ (DUF2314 family)
LQYGQTCFTKELLAMSESSWFPEETEWENEPDQSDEEDETPLLAIVGLLPRPMRLSEEKLAEAARKAWGLEIGIRNAEKDGFVMGDADAGRFMIYRSDGLVLVNVIDAPYVPNVEETAASLPDLRLQKLFSQHTAWLSCDLFLDEKQERPQRGQQRHYQMLGRLFAELMPAGTLLLYLPEFQRMYAVTEKTIAALRANDPLAALEETWEVPVIHVESDDPEMLQAQETARQTWPQFVAAFEAQKGSGFAVKVPLGTGEDLEFIWVLVEAIENDRIFGRLANEPVSLKDLEEGDRVQANVAEINDWVYLDQQGDLVGGYTIKVLAKRMQENQRQEED